MPNGQKIGQGGQGAVYKHGSNRVVKVSNISNRAIQEYEMAKVAGNLNIGPKVYGSNRNATKFWYFMNYVNGTPLKNIKNKSCYKKHVYYVVDKLHKAGIAHLDLHEDNIMIGMNGKVYIIDYGSARRTPNKSALTNNKINNSLRNQSKGQKWHRFYVVGPDKLLSNREELLRIFGPRN